MACFDALKGFFHVPLDENSKLLTAMLTPIGVFIYNVLSMGLTNANDTFEQCLHDILHGLDGVFNIADDILVIGETYEEFKDNVIRFLDQCVEKDLHLNADKFKLDCDTVTFFGHLLTKDGMKPDPKKVKDIREWPVPKDIKELQSLIGAVNYLARFIPHYLLSELHCKICSRGKLYSFGLKIINYALTRSKRQFVKIPL